MTTFTDLFDRISSVDRDTRVAAGRALHQLTTLRNWLIGASIVEFEQAGEDRAAYGERLIEALAARLGAAGCQGLSSRNLHNFRQVALADPGLEVVAFGRSVGGPVLGIVQASAASAATDAATIVQASAESASPEDKAAFSTLFPVLARRTQTQALAWRDASWLERLFTRLTFSHLLELARIDDERRRAFYELHCLKERWSTRELQRQKNSMLYERVGLSTHRDEVLALAHAGSVADSPAAQLRDPYVFEFLGLDAGAVVTEADLERALVDHLQQFLLELGRDFCFVARQYRITVGNRHHFVDLLLFHRRLRCLVAVDLKLGAFEPEHVGQLRFYVNYLAEEVALPDENPPVGILLCAERDAEVVRFATAGEPDLFVTRYQMALPSAERLARWLHDERARLEQQASETGPPP